MLAHYDGKKVRLVTEDGELFTGEAEYCSPGWGLDAFDREEESLQIGDTNVFLSQIRSVEPLDAPAKTLPSRSFDELAGRLLDQERCWIVDLLPERVPKEAGGQYFAVDRYFRQPERLGALYRRFAELLLRLNCYSDLAVSFDGGDSWELNPEPERFAEALTGLGSGDFFRGIFPAEEVMAELDAGDTYLAFCDPGEKLLPRLRKLALAGGFCLWLSEHD